MGRPGDLEAQRVASHPKNYFMSLDKSPLWGTMSFMKLRDALILCESTII